MLTDHKTFNSFDKHGVEMSNEGRFVKHEMLEEILEPHKAYSFTNKQQAYTVFSDGFIKGTGIMSFNAITWQDYEYVR